MKLSIETRRPSERHVELVLSGEIDYATSMEFRAAMTAVLDGITTVVIVDLAGVTFLDSTGVGTLVVARRICADVGVSLLIREVNPFVARLLGVVGVAGTLGVDVPAGAVAERVPRPRAEAAARA